jgi:hypothetical protein
MRRAAFILLILVLILGCKKSEGSSEAMANLPAGVPVNATSAQAERLQGGEASPAAPAAPLIVPGRMIIRDATISLIVRDSVQSLRAITAMVEAHGGYVSDARQWKDREQVRANATFRVPANQLNVALAAMRANAIRVESEAITAQDVSQEFSDLAAQQRTLEATEVELRQLLKTVRERTQKASEIMEIYTELTKVRGDIERISGRMQYLSQMTAMSTIKLELVPDVLAAPVIEPGWQPVATIKNASRSLINTLKALVDALIWIVIYLLPIVLFFIAIAMLIRAVWRRIRGPRPAAP